MRSIELTLKRIRKYGGIADVCERWLQFAKKRKDLFGFADIIKIDIDITAIQSCMYNNASAEKNKIVMNPSAKAWLMADGRIEIWAWRKIKLSWKPKIIVIRIEDMKV